MLICNECLYENFENNEGMFKSSGRCEFCEQPKVCNDIPSKYLRNKIKHEYEITITKVNFEKLEFIELEKYEVEPKDDVGKVLDLCRTLSYEPINVEYVVSVISAKNPKSYIRRYARSYEEINDFRNQLHCL